MNNTSKTIAIIGAGPSGLYAAEILSAAECNVHIFEQKPSPARKFLMAGRGGLNITHSEDYQKFIKRYGDSKNNLSSALGHFTPTDMRIWCHDLGQETFVGSSGRVFPKAMKASPLLRAWLKRLEEMGVKFHYRHTWTGWVDDKKLSFRINERSLIFDSDATLLALGGASWPSLGSDGIWPKFLKNKDIGVLPFEPSNCGFVISWSHHIKEKFSGTPLKGISLTCNGKKILGEMMITENGIEGGAVYALSSDIRREIKQNGFADLIIDLRPNILIEEILNKLKTPRGRQSFSTWLQKSLNLSPLSINLLREIDKNIHLKDLSTLAFLIKNMPIRTVTPFSIDRAISSAGGVQFEELDENFMLVKCPGTFAAGEMLDWEAPTGGYLLQGCFATGKAAAEGILRWIKDEKLA